MATYTTTSHERPTDAGYARGDVINVIDPAAPIASWIHLGSGVWERNDTVQVRTGPGGGTGITQIVSLTQAQYDALVIKDATTLYVIVGG